MTSASTTPSVQFEIRDLELNNIDDNGPKLSSVECPAAGRCDSIRAVVRYHLRAWTVAGGHVFFNVGGGLFGEGHEHAWLVGAATAVDSGSPFWTDASSTSTGTSRTTALDRSLVRLKDPIELSVPLKKVPRDALFGVHLTMDAEAIDDRGGESGASALIDDPLHAGPGLIARGLTARGAPTLKEPPMPAAPRRALPRRGPSPRRHGAVQQLRVRGRGGERHCAGAGHARRRVARRDQRHRRHPGGSARSGGDFKPTRTLVRFENGDTSPRLVEIPIREDPAAESPEKLHGLALPRALRASSAAPRSASVTILDDDQPPPPPPPTFTIGGTVDGLAGLGAGARRTSGRRCRCRRTGASRSPGPRPPASPTRSASQTQPTTPIRCARCEHGTGQVSVRERDRHRRALRDARGPVGAGLHVRGRRPGHHPGRRQRGRRGRGDPARREDRHRRPARGRHELRLRFRRSRATTTPAHLDPSFGTGGIATTDLGGNDDKALDAALTPGRRVRGRRPNRPRRASEDGLRRRALPARRPPRPQLRHATGSRPPTSPAGALANAVAVQPDGKIVVAGFAISASGSTATSRSCATTPTARSTRASAATASSPPTSAPRTTTPARSPSSPTARSSSPATPTRTSRSRATCPTAQLDPTFGDGGTTVSDLGFDDVANGVALTPGGDDPDRRLHGRRRANRDFLLARYGPNGKLNTGSATSASSRPTSAAATTSARTSSSTPNGRIVVVGRATSPTILDMALVRYNPDGTLDTSFDGDGILTADFHGRGDFGQDVALDSAGPDRRRRLHRERRRHRVRAHARQPMTGA